MRVGVRGSRLHGPSRTHPVQLTLSPLRMSAAPDFADLVQGMNGSAVGRSLHDGVKQVVGRTDWRALEIDGMGAKKEGREAGVRASNTRSFLYPVTVITIINV